MNDHYYTAQPQSGHKPLEITYHNHGAPVVFETDSGVFSRTEIDPGTRILLDALPDSLSGAVLDMGCGYGVMGVSVGKRFPGCTVTMADINQRACALAESNARRNGVPARVLPGDGYQPVRGLRFDWILQNPPIRAGKAVIYRMFADAAACLAPGGSLWLVIRKQQGAASALTYLQGLYGQVAVADKSSGYWVLRCASPLPAAAQGEERP